MAMVTLERCEKCKKWFESEELTEEHICETCHIKEVNKKAAAATGGDIKLQFLRYIERSGATSLATLAKKYSKKVTEQEAEEALNELEAAGEILKRESKNKKGKFVYERIRNDVDE